MELLDTRIYRALTIGNEELSQIKDQRTILVKPYMSRYSYAGDFFETPTAAALSAVDLVDTMSSAEKAQRDAVIENANARIDVITKKTQEFSDKYNAPMSMIHPYALINLFGSQTNYGEKNRPNYYDSESTYNNYDSQSNIIDTAGRLRWYEVDAKMTQIDTTTNGGSITSVKNYAKAPTTKDLINWSTYDRMGRFPYSFQDFVFCKYWNRIENNRLITLRRYPAPVLDNVIPANYKGRDSEAGEKGVSIYESAFAPLATAVTYFGEGTDNSIKDLLRFTVGYNWSELTSDVHQTTSYQINEGQVFNGSGGGGLATHLNNGLGALSVMLGLFGDFTGKSPISSDKIAGLPPDPYNNGPYENRVIGPVNVINKVYKRERGLKFEQDSIVLTFDYIARPIAHVNNKAILLDLLANIMAMCYSSGQWFGGAHRYRNEHPAVYPWRNTSSLNKIYQGKLFGRKGAFSEIVSDFFNTGNMEIATNFAHTLIEGIKAYAKDIVNAIKGGGSSSGGNTAEDAKAEEDKRNMKAGLSKIANTAGRAVAAHLMRGSQVPWLEGAKALLTGEPVGDWHITLGNPLNPIAMIGNLIVDNCEIEFSDELGPDDFPIGFKAKITLKHGMGRDKDAVESMFNRGNGRLYILSDAFKSSADSETSVDSFTGDNNKFKDKVKVQNWGALQTTGSFAITKSVLKPLANKGTGVQNDKRLYDPSTINLFKLNTSSGNVDVVNIYRTTPWAMHYIL